MRAPVAAEGTTYVEFAKRNFQLEQQKPGKQQSVPRKSVKGKAGRKELSLAYAIADEGRSPVAPPVAEAKEKKSFWARLTVQPWQREKLGDRIMSLAPLPEHTNLEEQALASREASAGGGGGVGGGCGCH